MTLTKILKLALTAQLLMASATVIAGHVDHACSNCLGRPPCYTYSSEYAYAPRREPPPVRETATTNTSSTSYQAKCTRNCSLAGPHDKYYDAKGVANTHHQGTGHRTSVTQE